jgi:hypothetical protein
MKKSITTILLMALMIGATPLRSQETSQGVAARRGEGAGYSTRDATVLAMMGWGLGLVVGIALLCGFLEQETSH